MCSFHTIVISLRLNVTLTIPGGFATALFHTHKTQNPWRVRARARACTSPASREHRKLLSKDQKCSCGLVPVPAMFIELTDYIKQCSAITSSSAYFFIQFFFTLPQLPENIALPRWVRDSLRKQQQLECRDGNPCAHSHLQGVRPPADERRRETQLFCYVRRENLYFGLVRLSAYLLFIALLRLIPRFAFMPLPLKGRYSKNGF